MHHLILISILVLFNTFILYPIEAKMHSLSFDLIHHDSKLSPFYNQSMSESEVSSKAIMRSLNRLNHFISSMSIGVKFVESDLTASDYFMSLAIHDITRRLAIPDLTSALIWVRCGPCAQCNDENPPLYDPTSSKTYDAILYGTDNCKADLLQTKSGESNGKSNVCRYQYQPSSNGFSSSGVLATETFYFKFSDNKDIHFPHIVFGCDDSHKGKFKGGVQGVIGLGQGKLSMVFQLRNKVGKKFSYCLKSKDNLTPSKIKFGEELKLYNTDIEYKAKLSHSPPHSHYYLSLETISVNNEKIEVPQSSFLHVMVIDIQTSLTSLPSNIYSKVITKFVEQANGISSVKYNKHDTACFLRSEIQKSMHHLPKIVFHFKTLHRVSSADFLVNPTTLLEDYDDQRMCMTIVKNDGLSVLGNKAQVDMQMLFDLSGPSLTFAPLKCGQFSI